MTSDMEANKKLIPIVSKSQSAHNVPATSPEGPLKVLTSGTYRGPLGDSQQTLRGATQKLMI